MKIMGHFMVVELFFDKMMPSENYGYCKRCEKNAIFNYRYNPGTNILFRPGYLCSGR